METLFFVTSLSIDLLLDTLTPGAPSLIERQRKWRSKHLGIRLTELHDKAKSLVIVAISWAERKLTFHHRKNSSRTI
jgi:hypothetical protein